jgi:threonine/homoserine/homoserine lactone efflux protein
LDLRITETLVFNGSKSFQLHIGDTTQLASQSVIVGVAIIVVDTSMIFGLGLVVGLIRRLLKRYRLITQGKESVEEKK